MNASEKAALVRAKRAGLVRSHAPTAAQRQDFILRAADAGTLNTMEIVAFLRDEYDIVVTEAEVWNAVRRPGEMREARHAPA